MAQCCIRSKRDDGIVDHERVNRAVRGQPVELTMTELRMAILLRHKRHGTGLNELARHFSYARSSVAEILQKHRG